MGLKYRYFWMGCDNIFLKMVLKHLKVFYNLIFFFFVYTVYTKDNKILFYQ